MFYRNMKICEQSASHERQKKIHWCFCAPVNLLSRSFF